MILNFFQTNRMNNGFNATSAFAKLGDQEQVALALSAGGKLEDAVYGYALGGHSNQLTAILSVHPELLNHAARGYARVDDEIETGKLSARNEMTIKQALLEGYAEASNITQVNAGILSRHYREYLPTIVKGLAAGNHPSVKQYAINPELQNIAISSAAQSGHVELVNALLAMQNIEISKLSKPLMMGAKIALGHALTGYSKGRYYEHIEALLKLNINPMLCLTAIADKDGLHGSDIQALCSNVSDEALRQSLLDLVKEHFGMDPKTMSKEDFSSDSALELLLETAKAVSRHP